MSRLFKRTLVFMVFAFALIAFMTVGISSYVLKTRLTSEYESKALAIAGSVSKSSVELLLSGNAVEIQSKIDQYTEIQGVAYVLVADRTGDVVAHTFVPVIPPGVVTVLWNLRVENGRNISALMVQEVDVAGVGEIIHVAQPVLAGEAGSVHIGMAKSVIQQAIAASVMQLLGVTLVAFLLCTVAAYFYVESISNPLTKLSKYARRVAKHDFSDPPVIISDDEVGELAATFESMSSELSDLVHGLERSVVNATVDVEDALATTRGVIENIADGLFVATLDGVVVQANTALVRMVGESQPLEGMDISHYLGISVDQMMTKSGVPRYEQGNMEAACDLACGEPIEVDVRRVSGEVFPAELSLGALVLHEANSIVGVVRDITIRRKAEQRLRQAHDSLEERVKLRTEELYDANMRLTEEVADRREAERKYRSLFENAVEGIFQMSAEWDYLDANPTMARIFGYDSVPELLDALRADWGCVYAERQHGNKFFEQLKTVGEVRGYQVQVVRKDGSLLWVSKNARAVYGDSGELVFYEGSVEDITERKQAESALLHQAYHDSLTGLPNRGLFLDHLSLALERSRRKAEYHYAVMYLDLDRFKIVNDSLGHNIGDDLLKHVARKLEQAVRSMDTVARFGGDEFAVLLEDMRAPKECVSIAKRILSAVKEPARLGGFDVQTSASIGIVLLSDEYRKPDAILRDADTAMYHAKEAGKSRFKVFNKRMHVQALEQLRLETELSKAVEAGAFNVEYLPMVNLDTGRLAGFEALLRWRHPVLGLVPPADFIPIAEDKGLIHPIGEWILRHVCRVINDWEQEFGPDAPVSVAVNLSAKQFVQAQLPGRVGELVKETGITPGNLALEIPETVLMDRASIAFDMLRRLKALGVALCMDDFGTGYSSLSYLRQFPIDKLKIDRSFISRSGDDSESQVLVKSFLSLANGLGIATVAEGVDTEVQLDMLRGLGCDYAQGYLFSQPVSREQAEEFLRDEAQLFNWRSD